MAPQKPSPLNFTNIACAIIITMNGIIINNQWEWKEWKGKKDEIDQEQNIKLTFLRSDFVLMGDRQRKTEDKVTHIDALMPDQKKRKSDDPN